MKQTFPAVDVLHLKAINATTIITNRTGAAIIMGSNSFALESPPERFGCGAAVVPSHG